MKITKRQLRKLVHEACGTVSLEKDDGNVYGHGGTARMAKSQLFQIATDAAELHDMLDEKDELPEWVQSKIAVMAHSMDAVIDHLEYKYRSQLGGEEIDMDDFVGVQLESYGMRRGGHGKMTARDIEGMLPPGVMKNTPGVSSILQRRALAAKMSKNELAAKIKAAKIKGNEHPRQFFKRLGFKY
tara:strand:+ start:6305 stop:6859 length:555 start_codon:yes stop_codon:yes gene_type:complete